MAYSGVATYWRLEAVAPLAAEDGLAGKLQEHVLLATGEPQAQRASAVQELFWHQAGQLHVLMLVCAEAQCAVLHVQGWGM